MKTEMIGGMTRYKKRDQFLTELREGFTKDDLD